MIHNDPEGHARMPNRNADIPAAVIAVAGADDPAGIRRRKRLRAERADGFRLQPGLQRGAQKNHPGIDDRGHGHDRQDGAGVQIFCQTSNPTICADPA